MNYFNAFSFVENLKYMGVGMLGVFMIVGIIIAGTYLINYSINKMTNSKNTRNK